MNTASTTTGFRAPSMQLRRHRPVMLPALFLAIASTALQAGGDVCRVTTDGAAGNDGTSWSQAKTLHGALATPDCRELWIKAGVYTPTSDGDRDARFNVRGGTALYGGFGGTETHRDQRDPATHRTVLSGDIGGDDIVDEHGITLDAQDIVGLNSHNVVWIETVGGLPVRFDSLTITAGLNHRKAPPSLDGASGRCTGMDPAACAGPLLQPEGEEIILGGGGIHCGAWSAPEVCAIQLYRAVLRGNAANQSAAMVCLGSDGGHCQVDIEASSFIGNAAEGWGGALAVGANTGTSFATLDVRTSTWVDNAAYGGGAIVFLPSQVAINDRVDLRQSTIVGNRVQENAGALMLLGGAPVEIDGLLAWDNGEQPFIVSYGTETNVRRSLLQDGCPMYAFCGSMVQGNPDLLALHEAGATPYMPVPAHSAAVDAIDCDAATETDQRGVARPQGERCDVGAVELRQAKVDVNVTGGGSVTAVIVPPPMSGAIMQCRQSTGSCLAHYELETSSPQLRLLLVADAGQLLASVTGCGGQREGHAWVIDALAGDCTVSATFGVPAHPVAGTVTGLVGSGLTLSLNGGAPLDIGGNGPFAFNDVLPAGASYSVAVVAQPKQPAQNCVVFNGSGVMAGNVDNVVVHCGAANSYTVGGTLSGLSMGESVGVSLNGGPTLTLAANGAYVFPQLFTSGEGYTATVAQQPDGQHCTFDHDSGVVGNGPVTDLDITCIVGGTQLQLTLSDNGDHAAYGRARSYQVTLTNAGPATASGIAVSATFDPAFNIEGVQWACVTGAPGASCGVSGAGGFADTATLPAGATAVWMLSVPVRFDSQAAAATLVIHADGAADATDTNTLVLFRDGLDVPYGEADDLPLH